MSGFTDLVSSPKVVITAPDGKQLWLDPKDVTSGSGSGAGTLMPDGFGVNLQFGDAPADDPNVTTSVSRFLGSEALIALTGPTGLMILGLAISGAYLMLASRRAHTPVSRRRRSSR